MVSRKNQLCMKNSRLRECITSTKSATEKLIELRRCLEQRADVNTTDVEGKTPLHLAMRRKKVPLSVVRLLLKWGADVNARDVKGITPLHVAVEYRETSASELLLNNSADVNAQTADKNTALHKVAWSGALSTVELLLNNGADVNAQNEYGNTPLHEAARYGKTSMVELLLHKGADVNARAKEGETALHAVIINGSSSVVELLLSNGANVNAITKNKDTPLHEAARYGKIHLVKLFLNKGADVNAQNTSKETALHEALRFGNDLVSLLLRSGADVTLRNKAGETPLSYALLFPLSSHKETIKLLQDAEEKNCNEILTLEQSQNSNTYDISKSHGQDIVSAINITNNVQLNYSKTNDNCGMLGQLYETKLLCLIFIRLLNHQEVEHDIFLGSNIDGIGAMDDICLRYQVRKTPRPSLLFIQAKHKEDCGDRITDKDLWLDSGNFSLRKYFKSYITIMQRFQDSDDPMFKGKFNDIDCYFILYTSGKERIAKKIRNTVNEILRSLINTTQNTEPFQYRYDDTDIDRLAKEAAQNQTNCLESTRELVKDFFNRLWFFTSQAKEDDVEGIVNNEINKYYNNAEERSHNYIFKFHSNAIFLRAHNEIHNWWKRNDEKPVYLSRSDDFFKHAKLACLDDVLLTVLNAMYHLKVSIDLKFNHSILERDIFIETAGTLNTILSRLFKIIYTKNIIITIDNNLKNQIVNLLLNDEKLASKITLPDRGIIQHFDMLDKDSCETSISSHLHNIQHLKRAGTSEDGGVLYRTKMLCLVLLRVLKYEQEFLLGTKISGMKAMNDICLRYQAQDQQRPVVLFVQLIHRDDPENRPLTDESLWNYSDDFNLLKFFKSYLVIRDRFLVDNKNPMFEGEFHGVDCYFIVYTSAKERVTKKKTKNRVSNVVKDLLNTGKAPEPFQFDYNNDDLDCLTNAIVMDEIEYLGTVFLQCVLHEKYKALLSNKVIVKYHVAMAQEVLQQCEVQPTIEEYRLWQFRTGFFKSELEHIIVLRQTFAKILLSKRCIQKNITKEYQQNGVIYDDIKMLESLKIKLPPAFGNLDMTFRGSKAKVDKRIKSVANKLVSLLKINEDTKIVRINDDDVGVGNTVEQGMIDINGGIGGAVGNLLIYDTDSNMLKLNLDDEKLPQYASLLLRELKDPRHEPFNENLNSYRFKICINGFPKYALSEDDCDKKLTTDFLDKLWFSPSQAKEDQVERTIKDEINQKYSYNKVCTNVSDLISLQSLDVIQRWWLQTTESPFLSRASRLFESIESTEVYNLLQTVINYMYIANIGSIDIKVSRVCRSEQFEQILQVFKNLSLELFKLIKPEFDESLDYRPPNNEYYENLETSKLSLRIHPEMEWVSLTMVAEFRNVDYYSVVTKVNLRSETCQSKDVGMLNEICSGAIYFTIKSQTTLLRSAYHLKAVKNTNTRNDID